MTYGWRTNKTFGFFRWEVYRVEYQQPLVIIFAGHAPTRARAAGEARRQVKILRRRAAFRLVDVNPEARP
jgi:hypothetical protein